MRIIDFTVRNFKSIKTLTMNNLGDFNVLVGRNDTGKSNVLDALLVSIDGLSGKVDQHSQYHDHLWPDGRKDQSMIEIDATISVNAMELEILTHGHDYFKRFRQAPIIHIQRVIEGDERRTTLFKIDEGILISDEIEPTNETRKIHEVFFRLPHSVKRIDVIRGQVPPSSSPFGLRGTVIPSDTLQTIQNWVDNDTTEDKRKFELLNSVFQTLSNTDWRLRQDSKKLFIYTDIDTGFSITEVGGGIQELIHLAYMLVDLPDFLLIEEPETHNHPEQTSRIFRVLKEISKEQQVFVTTHSSTFIEHVKYTDVYHIKKDEGYTVCSQVQSEGFVAVAQDLGLRPVHVYLTNSILFIEGPCDELVFNSWAGMLGHAFHPPIVQIRQMKGMGNSKLQASVWKEVRESIDIPLVWVFDNNEKTKKTINAMKRRGVEKSSIILLERGDIEDYYPLGPTVKHLMKVWKIDKSLRNDLLEILSEGGRVRAIRKFLNEHAKDTPNDDEWKIPLAKHVAYETSTDDYDPDIWAEISEIMNQIKFGLSVQ
ncbi:MAG: AAA family ATPase [Candidatus Thorarchaeota archaeon]